MITRYFINDIILIVSFVKASISRDFLSLRLGNGWSYKISAKINILSGFKRYDYKLDVFNKNVYFFC